MTPVHGELGKRGGNTSHCHSRELKKCGQLNVKCWGGGATLSQKCGDAKFSTEAVN